MNDSIYALEIAFVNDKYFSEKLDKNLRFSYSSLKIIYSTHTHAAAARVGKVKPHTLPMVNVGLTKIRSKIMRLDNTIYPNIVQSLAHMSVLLVIGLRCKSWQY